jgi:transcriptional regulator MraZ
MFRGQFDHAIDAKGRTSLPSRFRDVLMASGDARLVLTPSPFDPCLHLFPLRSWEELEAKIAAQPQFELNVIRLRRLYVSGAVECELDKHGRVLVPTSLRDYAQLAKDVHWAGMGRMVELWAKEKWVEANAMTAADRDELRRSLSEQVKI